MYHQYMLQLWLLSLLRWTVVSTYLPCDPSKEYIELAQCKEGSVNAEKLAIAKHSANTQLSQLKNNITATLQHWIASDPMTRDLRSMDLYYWSTSFTVAIRDYHAARKRKVQLDLISCVGDLLSLDNANDHIRKNGGCHPYKDDYMIDPSPPSWSKHALEVTDLIDRSMFVKHACAANLFCETGPAKKHRSLDDQFKEASIQLLKANNLSESWRKESTEQPNTKPPMLCLNTHKGGACSLFTSLKLFFDYCDANNIPLDGLRLFSLGSDAAFPTVEELDGVGFPSKWRLTGHDAFFDFKQWQDYEYDIQHGIEHSLLSGTTKTNGKIGLSNSWLPDIEKFEQKYNFSWFGTNLVVDYHSRFFPFPIGIAYHFGKELNAVRKQLRESLNGGSNAYTKKKLLLLNFKSARGSLQGSSERTALYRLSGLGKMQVDLISEDTGLPVPTEHEQDILLEKEGKPPAGGNSIIINQQQADVSKKYRFNDKLAFADEDKAWLWADIEPRYVASKWGDDDLETYFKELASYHFVLSPRGNGLDCFRTWEALAVGTIPIVKRSGPFDKIYEGLPVLVVDRWEDVTLELLDKTMKAWKHEEFPALSKLSWRAWI